METGRTESMLMELLTLVHGIKDEQASFAQQVNSRFDAQRNMIARIEEDVEQLKARQQL